jgi:hypothetical protein
MYFDGGIIDNKRTYRRNSIGDILGFRPANYASIENARSYEIEAPYPHNLELDRYIIMKIRGMCRYDSVNKNVQDAFCVIPLDIRTGNFSIQNVNNIDNESLTYQFAKGTKLSKFVIEFVDWSGNPYNFRGLDHFMTFEVLSESHRQNGLPRS